MWALHNSLKGWTLYDLNVREVQLLINSMTINELKLIQICSSGLSWVKFNPDEFPQFVSETGKKSDYFTLPTLEFKSDDTDTDFFVVKSSKNKLLPRLHSRIEKSFKILILGTKDNFESLTLDISEGGIQFKDVIPSWVAGYFIVQLIDGLETYSVMCSLVEDQSEKKRVQIMSEEHDINYLKYKGWLEKLRI